MSVDSLGEVESVRETRDRKKAMKPCPCGHRGDPRHACRCPPPLVDRYRGRISGPLLDRIDLHVEVPAVTLSELRGRPSEKSSEVAARVLAARQRQSRRFSERCSSPVNAAMRPEDLRQHCRLEDDARRLLDTVFERLKLSARAVTRILKVARTIADLEGAEHIRSSQVGEAIQYRSLDRRMECR